MGSEEACNLAYNLLTIWRWVSVLSFKVSQHFVNIIWYYIVPNFAEKIEFIKHISFTLLSWISACGIYLKKMHFLMERLFSYSRKGVRGWSGEIENQKVIKTGKQKWKAEMQESCIYCNYKWSLFKDGCYSKEKCYVTRLPCFSHSEPA